MSRTVPLVLGTHWSVSKSYIDRTLSSPSVVAADDGMVTLNVYQWDGRQIIHHPDHNGRKFATQADADAYCLTHHLLFPYIGTYATEEQREAAHHLADAHDTTVIYASTRDDVPSTAVSAAHLPVRRPEV